MTIRKRRTFITTFLQILSASHVWGTCIFLNDCPVALKYIEKRRNDPQTVAILQGAHCGFQNRGRGREAQVHCDRIPEFEDLPEGCVKLDECPAAKELIRTRKYDPEVVSLLRSSTCGYNNKRDMILCNKVTPKSASGNSKAHLLPKRGECGLQMPTSKITGGQRAELEDFPWMAVFKYKNETGHVAYRCHGALISKRYVVTAAHCLRHTSAQKRKIGNLQTIVLGEYDVTTDRDCPFPEFGGACADPVQEFTPESVHIHPNFQSPGAISDIALIRLNKDATYSDYIKPICLPLTALNLRIGETMLIGGWGRTETRAMSNVKLKARISYLPDADCAQFEIDKTQICAGSTTTSDTCSGDSGGPLMVLRQSQDRETTTYLAGVVSFGGACGSGTAIYTKVTFFINWILDNLH